MGMTKLEALKIATELNAHFDGFQKGIGYQFTDNVTDSTTYGNTPDELRANLNLLRERFKLSKALFR
jgi:hypothetical protein